METLTRSSLMCNVVQVYKIIGPNLILMRYFGFPVQELPLWHGNLAEPHPLQSVKQQQRDLWDFYAANAGDYGLKGLIDRK